MDLLARRLKRQQEAVELLRRHQELVAKQLPKTARLPLRQRRSLVKSWSTSLLAECTAVAGALEELLEEAAPFLEEDS